MADKLNITPGEWLVIEYENDDDDICYGVIAHDPNISPLERTIFEYPFVMLQPCQGEPGISWMASKDTEHKANCHLIAAAPDMQKAIRETIFPFDALIETVNSILADSKAGQHEVKMGRAALANLKAALAKAEGKYNHG